MRCRSKLAEYLSMLARASVLTNGLGRLRLITHHRAVEPQSRAAGDLRTLCLCIGIQMPSSRHIARVIGTCFLINLIEGYDTAAPGVAAPRLMPSLGIGTQAMGVVFSAGMLGMLFGTLLGGSLADRLGRKPVLIAAVALLGVSTLVTSFVHGFLELATMRLAAGVAIGGALPSLIALTSETAPGQWRVTLVTIIFMGFPLGGMLVAVVGAVGVPHFGWPLIFQIGGIAPLLVSPLAFLMLIESRRSHDRDSPRIPLRTLFSGELRLATPLLCFACALTLIAFYLLMNWLPAILVGKGFRADFAPWAALAFSFGNLVSAGTVGLLIDRFGMRWPAVGLYLLLAADLLALAWATRISEVLGLAFGAGYFAIGAQLSIYGITPAYYPRKMRATGISVVLGAGRLGSVFGPLIAGYLMGIGFSGASVVRLMAVAIPIAALAIYALPPPPAYAET